MYIINNEVCSRLVCKEHEVMKGKTGFLVGRDSNESDNEAQDANRSKVWLCRRALGYSLTYNSPCSTNLPQINNLRKAVCLLYT